MSTVLYWGGGGQWKHSLFSAEVNVHCPLWGGGGGDSLFSAEVSVHCPLWGGGVQVERFSVLC